MEDSAIVQLYWARNEEAIAETDQKYHPYCYTISNNILNHQQDAEECVNDTWLRAWNAIPPTRPFALQAFLGRITRNLSLDRYRSQTAEKRVSQMALIDHELDQVAGGGQVDDRLNVEETARLIERFLTQHCDQTCRVLFLRRYWYGDSIAAIARRCALSQSAVKSNLHRTRKRLRQYLEQEGVAVS